MTFWTVVRIRYCCCSVPKLCLTLCDPMNCGMPGFSVFHYLPEFGKLMSIELVMPSNCLMLCEDLTVR